MRLPIRFFGELTGRVPACPEFAAIWKNSVRCRFPPRRNARFCTTTPPGCFRRAPERILRGRKSRRDSSEGERMEIKTVAIIGAGTMGRGIAYCSALAGYRTILEDMSPSMQEQGIEYIRRAFDEGIARGKATEEQKQQSLAHIVTSGSVQDACREADLVIEAVPEEMEVKLEIFTILDKFAKPGAIFASNTSSLSITEMAAITFRAENCIGMHFFNPVQKMKLLEIVRGLETSETTVAACAEAGRRMGKEVVVVRESPGFVTSRINAMIGN